jgi:myo-inositol 2-dehydrogenase/D-chiro-inositol 1-dehydrogenase
MGEVHARHLQGAICGGKLIAAAVDPAHRQRLRETSNAPCPLVNDVEELVRYPGIDAIVVASNTVAHFDHVTIAAEHGKAIFAEKPLADSVERTRDAVATIEQAGVPFQIGFQRRFDPSYARAHELISAGAIGTPEMFRGISCDLMPPVDYLRTSGGLFWDLGIHDFDAARFLMDDEIVEVEASGTILIEPRLAEFDDVDHGIVVLKFSRGGIGVVQNAWRAPYGYDIRAEVHGSDGKIVAEVDDRYAMRHYSATGFRSERHHQFTERFRDAYLFELQAFVDAVKTGQSPSPGPRDALQAALVSDAATHSRRTAKAIESRVHDV